MIRWNSERILLWAAGLALAAFVLMGLASLAPQVVPAGPARLAAHVAGFVCFGLCALAVVVDPRPVKE